MQQLLAALLALVSSFSQHGQPASTPPFTQDEVSVRGASVSELAKRLHLFGQSSLTNSSGESGPTGISGENGEDEDTGSSGQKGPTGATGISGILGPTGSSGSKTEKEDAVNIRSGFMMPARIPQIAIDHSQALEGNSPSGTPFPLPPGRGRHNN